MMNFKECSDYNDFFLNYKEKRKTMASQKNYLCIYTYKS